MNKSLLALALGLTTLASAAHADIITCSFTEPFVTTTYSMASQSLKIDGDKKQVLQHVSFQIKDAGHFQLVDKDGKVLQDLKLTGKGSDGMSDAVYPFEATDSSMQQYANGGVGGCESNSLKAKGK